MTRFPSPSRFRRAAAFIVIALGLMVVAGHAFPTHARGGANPAGRVTATSATGDPKVPVFAYYYMWFQPSSWDRAKADLPLLGAYDSADPTVIAQHVRWAREAGIGGFIVSWKHEPRLDAPLAILVDQARRQDFKLILLYEALDFQRNPLPVSEVITDLQWFAATYGANPSFGVFGPPTVIWSGSWKFSHDDVAKVRAAAGAPTKLLLFGSERGASDYLARKALFDGDAYYWSSADPQQTPGYQRRLNELADAVRKSGGHWIAPVAPGFDARLVGGSSIVARREGATYRDSWSAAVSSRPSALGIISWNEFSENSHIEPSRSYAYSFLDLTAQLTGSPPFKPDTEVLPPNVVGPTTSGPVDSSELGAGVGMQQQLLSLLVSLALIGTVVLSALRSRTRMV